MQQRIWQPPHLGLEGKDGQLGACYSPSIGLPRTDLAWEGQIFAFDGANSSPGAAAWRSRLGRSRATAYGASAHKQMQEA